MTPAPLPDQDASASQRPASKPVEKPRPVSPRTRVLAWAITGLVRVICATLRIKVVNEEAVRAAESQKRGVILVTWHGRVFIPLDRCRKRGYWTIVSLSRDGDLQAENFRRSGYRIIRGSTGRRGAGALREGLAVLANGGVLTLVPDGPRGPGQKVQPGVVYFAQRSGRPIIPVGVSAWPRWLAPSWDRFLVPLPFARAMWINGDPIYVAPGEDLEQAALRVEQALLAAEAEAERCVVPRHQTKPPG